MNDSIGTFLEYFLDVEAATEDVSISQEILQNAERYDKRNVPYFKQFVDNKLKQWIDVSPTDQVASMENLRTDTTAVVSDDEQDDDVSSESEQEDHEAFKLTEQQLSTYVDIGSQCQRILQFLYHCQQQYVHFTDLYFHTLEQCIKSNNNKIIIVTLQQIALHLSEMIENANERKRLAECLHSNVFSSSVPESYKSILSTIQTLLSPSKTKQSGMEILSFEEIDVLYSPTAHFLDARREFRDSTNYFIDGDSLLLSVAHHRNVDLTSYYGNILHVIFIIERILLTLFHQSYQCNYVLIFFDCHYKLYQKDSSIITLIRACLIAHLSRNTNNCRQFKIHQFSSWLADDYVKFIRDEKPLFIFYHDMSSFDIDNDKFLSRNTLHKLISIYRLFGNYHQFSHRCHLYLMNKLTLTDTTVKCFQVEFQRRCQMPLLTKILNSVTSDSPNDVTEDRDWSNYEQLCYEIDQGDIRLFFYLKTLTELMENNRQQTMFKLLSPLLILHVALLIRLSLVDRHVPPLFFSRITFSSLFTELINQFRNKLSSNLGTHASSLLSWSKVADLFDGHLFVFTLYRIKQSLSHIRFDSNTFDIVKRSLTILNIPPSEQIFGDVLEQIIRTNDIVFPLSLADNQPVILKSQRQKVARISNAFLDTYLKPILSSSSSELLFDLVDPSDSCTMRYEGKHHWHVYKDVGDEISRIRDNDRENQNVDKKRYRTRGHQKFYDYFTLYGRSLTSHDIKDNQPQIVLPAPSACAQINAETTTDRAGSIPLVSNKKQPKCKSQLKKKGPTKDEIIEKNKQRRMNERISDETEKLVNIDTRLKEISSVNYSEAIDLIDENLPKFHTSINRLELLKTKFHRQRTYLQTLKKKNPLTLEEKSALDLLQIGYFTTMTEMVHLENVLDAFHEQKEYMEELIDDSPLDREKWYRFQLEKINSRLPRREQGVRDDRVSDFIPDKWQVKFLDAVDKRQSIIILAPTASGKTYASYYAMEKVCKDKHNPNGICVYVAPTKALVNQVAATIHSKFGPIFGIFTRDYRMNMRACRILVTVPQCLEILLLTPARQRWCQRIEYCIFDEIHCMSGEIGADVWEKTMLLINCPMIGLSATVSNGNELCQWIQNVEKQRSELFKTPKARQVCYIVHQERMADLNKYLYSNRQLIPVHPIGLMNSKQLTTSGLPKDLTLSPCETLQLNDALQKTCVDKKSNVISTLVEHFSPDWIIERNLCNNYSRLICNQFNALIDHKQISTIDSITDLLKPITSNKIHYPEQKSLSLLIVDFILTLKQKNLLPCIVFADSRILCEEMADNVACYLAKLERNLRETKYRRQLEVLQTRLEKIENPRYQTKVKKLIKVSTKKGVSRESGCNPVEIQMMTENIVEQMQFSGHERNLLSGILEEGTLAKRHGYDSNLVDSFLKRCSPTNPRLARYMRRGLAYHHAGLNNKGRVAVEALFRNRCIQVVFSTSTLAMGIHMPTKTVAFVGDSIYFDALQYRQSSGRAGRRGFDVQGHVVFVDIPLSKIRHLIASSVPNIHAHFPTSVTFFMRLLHLCSNADDPVDAQNRALIALQCPFILQLSSKYRLVNTQLRFHSLFTSDFLHRLNLINKQGNLVGLAGLLTHLHYFEPANILLVYLMDTRLFHEVKDDNEIVLILAYLFTYMPWLITQKQYETISLQKREEMYNSNLFLPTISTNFRERVHSYNSIVTDVYGLYIDNVIRHLRSFDDYQEQVLPFSTISFVQLSDYDNGTFEYDLHHHYSQQANNPSISPFASLSGLTHEQYMTNYNPTIGSWDLAYDLDLSSRIVPYVDIDHRDHTNSIYYLNSYAYDFFRHGSEKQLLNENNLSSGNTYKLLLDFKLILSSIKTSLEVIIKNDEKQTIVDDAAFFLPLYNSMTTVQTSFAEKFHKEYDN